MIATGRLTTYPGRRPTRSSSRALEPAGVGALMALLEERKQQARRRGPVRRGAQAAAAVPARRDRRRHLADRRGHPRHPASPRRPLSRATCWSGRCACRATAAAEEIAAAIRGFNALPATAADAAARPPHRRARRRLDRGSVGLQRGDRGARRGGEPDSADLRRRPRDRHHPDRLCRRPARADADRRRRNGRAGARRARSRASTVSRAGSLGVLGPRARARRTELRAAARALPTADDAAGPAAPAPRCCRRPAASRAHGQRAAASRRIIPRRRRLDAARRCACRSCATASASRAFAARAAAACGCRASAAAIASEHRLGLRQACAPTPKRNACVSRAPANACEALAARGRARHDRRHRSPRCAARARGQLLAALSYHGVLARGFALVRAAESGDPVRSAAAVSAGTTALVRAMRARGVSG